MDPANLVETATGSKHPDHPWIGGIKVREQQERAWCLVRDEHREMRKRPNGDVDDRQVGSLVGQQARLRYGRLVRRHDHAGTRHVVPGVDQSRSDALFHVARERRDLAMHARASVRDGEDRYASH